MKALAFAALGCLAFVASPLLAQDDDSSNSNEIVVTGMRNSVSGITAIESQPPVIGLKRTADSAVRTIEIVSDSREEAMRKREIHTILLATLDRAAAAGVELVTGTFELVPVTKANYQDLPLIYAGRVDTSQVTLMVKVKLAGSITTAEQRLDAFIKSVPRSGRGTLDKTGSLTLTIVNPDQYRDAIVTLVAENARHYAAMFGPDYAVQVTGVDGQVAWSQVSGTDVFLYVPYRYTILPK